jgi:Cyclin, N-terminal domain
MEDRNIFFIVVRLVDLYYCNQSHAQPKQELQLNAIASIFVASKLLQINHINLAFCFGNIGHNKFSYSQITDRETDIMNLVGWEVTSCPTVYEVFELAIMMVRRRLHMRVTEAQTVAFLSECQSLGASLLRASLCTLDSLKKKSIEQAAAAI